MTANVRVGCHACEAVDVTAAALLDDDAATTRLPTDRGGDS